jgi:dihydroorotate dehydrogenase
VAAGIIKAKSQIEEYSEIPEIAALVIGDFSEKQNYPRGTGCRFYYDETAGAAYNAFRLRNPGRKAVSKYLPEAIKAVKAAGQKAIVGITPLKHENPFIVVPSLAEWALDMGADGVEINTSCPNEGSDNLLCHDMAKTKNVIAAARQSVGPEVYLMVKFSAFGEMCTRRYKDGLEADAVSTMNGERKLSPTNLQTGQPFIEVNEGYAGQSGPFINRLARKSLRSWLRPSAGEAEFPVKSPQYDVWSVGGIDSGYEAHDRVNNIGAFMVGGAQAFYRAQNPAEVAKCWAREYEEAEAAIG